MVTKGVENHQLGEPDGVLLLRGLEALQRHSCAMAAQCRRRLLLYSRRLDPRIYDQPCFVEAVKRLAIRHPRTRIRILVADSSLLARGGRLLQLIQDLPSHIAIRRRHEEYEEDARSFLLADEAGVLLRNPWHDFDAVRADYGGRSQARRLAEEFERIWERSHLDPALRRLHL